MEGTLLAVHIGAPQHYLTERGVLHTAIFKDPVAGPIALGSEGLEGDSVADTVHHGGTDNAVLMYAAANYDRWQQEERDFPFGGFGENFVVSGMDENTVCLGDIFSIGDQVRVQVTQPRVPCEKLSLRWNDPDLAVTVVHNLRTGWYIRILQTGTVQAGTTVTLIERPHPDWPLTRAARIRFNSNLPIEEAQALAHIPELSQRWQEWAQRKLATVICEDGNSLCQGTDSSVPSASFGNPALAAEGRN